MKRARLWMALVPAVMLAWAAAAWAANPSPEEVCLAGKEVAAGEYGECRLRAEATLISTDNFADYEKAIAECGERLIEKFALLEDQAMHAGGTCPTVGDAAAMLALVTTHTNEIVGMLTGMGVPAVCGNGVLEPGEECEWGVLGVDPEDGGRIADCHVATSGWLPLGYLGCSPGTCKWDTSDCFWGCAGVMHEGVCWMLSEPAESCLCTCLHHHAWYNNLTETVVDADSCNAILTVLGVPTEVPFVEYPLPEDFDREHMDLGVGCAVYGEGADAIRMLFTGEPVTSVGFLGQNLIVRRVCACEPEE